MGTIQTESSDSPSVQLKTKDCIDNLLTTDFVAIELNQLNKLSNMLEVAARRVTDDELFWGIIRAVLDRTDTYPEKLAEELGVSYSTIGRWMNKVVAPHPAKRRQLFKAMKALCTKEIRSLRKLQKSLKLN